jgi:hypothetical protein
MTKETTNFLVSGTYELGQEIQKHVQDGWTLVEGSPSDHGWQKEVRMERGELAAANDKPAQEPVETPKPKGRPKAENSEAK